MYNNKEIEDLIDKKKIILTTYGHNGLDWLQSMIDGNSGILMMPAFSFFRTMKYLNIRKNLSHDDLAKILSNAFYKDKTYLVRRRRFIFDKNEYLDFKKYLKFYLKKNICNNFYENIFFSVHLSFAQIKNINLKNINCIICQEHLPIYLDLYKKFFKKNLNFIVMMRNPKAAIAGSINSQTKSNNKLFLPSQDFALIMHTWFAANSFFKKKNDKSTYTIINEKINKNQKKELKKLFQWIGVKIKKINFKETILGKTWHGESSYLETNKEKDNIKKPPKNFYSKKNVEKRWRNILDQNTILVIENLLCEIFKKYNYKLDLKTSYFARFNAYITYLFIFNKIKFYKKKKFFFLSYGKYFFKRIIIIHFPFFANRIFKIK